ncbi:ABC transporter ATP-binding protein [Mycoplasma sp. 888]|uniref:ABC transporter ATP-binding protein n=1 Tax=Mycoplasma sp. 888 TaxID=3108483 RepID=UPI002D77A078|nr:ABC transporter ATP-binding protein [Mycoplasma sp. 888]WRQ26021.1 ABC transporter ATP-binding protein [Mycoplasma sp. 888]
MSDLRKEQKEITQDLQANDQVKVFKTLKQLLSYFSRSKKTLFVALLFSLLNSIFYIIGSFLIGIIVQIFFEPYLNSQITYPGKFNLTNFILMLSALTLTFILYGICRYVEQRLYIKLSFEAGATLRKELLEKILKMPVSFYDKNKTGDLISTLIVDVNNTANSLFQMMTQVVTSIFNICITIIVLMLVSSLLTLIVLPITLILFGLVFLLIKKSQPYFVKVQNSFGRLNAFVEEMLTNTKVTNSFDRQAYVYSELEKITYDIRKSAYKGDVIAKSFDIWYTLIANFVILLISGLAAIFYFKQIPVWNLIGLGVDQNGNATPAFIILFISLNWNFMGPFQNILSSAFNAQIGIASSSRIFKLLEISEPDTSNQTIVINSIKGHVQFDNVYFKYNPDKLEYQLKAASFDIKPGHVVAIVGPTGAGKTTIISLLSKYYDYTKGSIKIDGNELRNIKTDKLRDHMTIVLQDSFLFNESIKDNLKMTNQNATDEQIIKAAEMTHAHHFIMNMPQGYDTMIENNGANLSQGQRQLLSLTRAILSNKNLLILDEATSNIDSATEQIVQKAMWELMKNKTTFVIAHRLSTIKNADVIIVVNNGLIIEKGAHKELLDKKGFYHQLYTSQFEFEN